MTRVTPTPPRVLWSILFRLKHARLQLNIHNMAPTSVSSEQNACCATKTGRSARGVQVWRALPFALRVLFSYVNSDLCNESHQASRCPRPLCGTTCGKGSINTQLRTLQDAWKTSDLILVWNNEILICHSPTKPLHVTVCKYEKIRKYKTFPSETIVCLRILDAYYFRNKNTLITI